MSVGKSFNVTQHTDHAWNGWNSFFFPEQTVRRYLLNLTKEHILYSTGHDLRVCLIRAGHFSLVYVPLPSK